MTKRRCSACQPAACGSSGRSSAALKVYLDYQTIVKTRLIAGNNHLLRADQERDAGDLKLDAADLARAAAAITMARRIGLKIIDVTGQAGGQMAADCDALLNVPATKAAHIQEMHIAIGHMICGLVERALNA